jgi:hypothetical protein
MSRRGKRPPDLDRRPSSSGPTAPLAVELFSGTAGATAAFRDAGWRVVTVDVDERHKPDIVADVRALPLMLGPDVGRPVELLWCSPPCTEFSDANPNKPLRPSLELFNAAMAAVRMMRPRFWIIENVRGAIPHFGIPVQKVGPWCLWGYFPELRVTLPMHDHRKSCGTTNDRRRGRNTRGPVESAAVPRALSDALLAAVVRGQQVTSILDLRPFRRHRHVAAIGERPADGALELAL